MTEVTEPKRGHRKIRNGVVVSDVQDKTIVVRVERLTRHPLYKKVITRAKNYHVHDEENEAKVGDRVRIAETRPLSKLKRWRLVSIVQRAVTE
ncbi:MAG: 30S ribosomal protein S17 [Candidatus Pacebacteria bacterium]|nr:30S ribosomal protein S17 [Candidatus Paceibacterota bacterium]